VHPINKHPICILAKKLSKLEMFMKLVHPTGKHPICILAKKLCELEMLMKLCINWQAPNLHFG
jgi:hypothetical protein